MPDKAAEALVLSICGPGGTREVEAFAERWTRVVPRCAFACVEADLDPLGIGIAPVQDLVTREIRDVELALPQIVLLGERRAAPCVLDLALCSALADVNAILVDVPADGIVTGFPAPRGAFRFVQHRCADDPDGRHFDHMIHGLRDAGLDIRTMVMPDDPGATDRAIGTFLVELVARASRHRTAPHHDRGRSAPRGHAA